MRLRFNSKWLIWFLSLFLPSKGLFFLPALLSLIHSFYLQQTKWTCQTANYRQLGMKLLPNSSSTQITVQLLLLRIAIIVLMSFLLLPLKANVSCSFAYLIVLCFTDVCVCLREICWHNSYSKALREMILLPNKKNNKSHTTRRLLAVAFIADKHK